MTLLLSVLYQENNHKADQWYEYFFGWAGEEVQEEISESLENWKRGMMRL